MVCFSFHYDWISWLILAPPLVGLALMLLWLLQVLQLLFVPLYYGSIYVYVVLLISSGRSWSSSEIDLNVSERPGGRPRRICWLMKLMKGIVAKLSDFRSLVTEMGQRKVFWWTFLRCHLPWGTQKEHPLFDGDFGSESWAGRSDLIRFQL